MNPLPDHPSRNNRVTRSRALDRPPVRAHRRVDHRSSAMTSRLSHIAKSLPNFRICSHDGRADAARFSRISECCRYGGTDQP
jgi:hypothetical protein